MLKQDSNTIWTLGSGNWCINSEQGYVLESFLDSGKLTERNRGLFEQLYRSYLDQNSGKIFPPEFKYHPETGKPLKRTQGFNANDVWIAPYGQSVFIENQNRKDNGLQYSRELKTLKNNQRQVTDHAEIEISHSFNGSVEFFSICIGAETPQLIAINKNRNDEIYLFLEHTKDWVLLKNTGRSLGKCPEQWQDYWGVEAFYQSKAKTHILLLPTNHGLAELSIDGKSLQYTVNYHGLNQCCLGKPIYWNNCIYIPMDNNGKVQVWNYTKQKVELTTDINTQYFNRVVFEDQSTLIWLSDQGQFILEKDVENHISNKFIAWLPMIEPDFKYGSPFINDYLYQLCWNTSELQYVYVRLNSRNNNEKAQPCTSARFTTGSIAYSLEGRISDRRDHKGRKIWESPTKMSEQNEGLFVPFMESQDLNKNSVLGIRFNLGDKSIASIFDDSSELLIFLRINNTDFFSGQFSEPLKKSRFFYHHHYLYFYHPDRHILQGWEVEA